MMKFLFALIGGAFLISLNSSYFWLISNFFVFLFIMFLLMSSSFLEFYIYSFDFSMDTASYSLIVLSFWVTILMYYSSSGIKMNNSSFSYFFLCVYFLMLILFLSFSCLNILGFYFFFETSLIPTLLIILGWGYQPERLQAGIYFLFYTLTASLPLLLVLLYIYYTLGSLDSIFFNYFGVKNLGEFIFLMMTLAFLVKMPMFFTHLWLPKAHVEAPVSGSMILAGVLLKLGGYGLYRVLPFCLTKIMMFSNYLYGISILGMLYVGIMCCRLNDLKALVAYSSVAHMGLVVCGIFSCFIWGYTGSLMMMISHGLASSGLFCIVNMYYERLGSRSLYLNKGLILILPLFSFFFFVLSAANMAAPPTVNLLSEIFLMATILKFDKIMFLVFPLGSYLGAVFTLFMFSYSQHGKSYYGVYSYLNISFREYHTLILHVLPVNFLILKSEYFMYLY